MTKAHTAGPMILVEMTQYLQPRYRQRKAKALIPARYRGAYKEMTALGCRLTAEILETGKVRLAIEHNEAEYAVRVTQASSRSVREALNELMEGWSDRSFDRWLEVLSWGIWRGPWSERRGDCEQRAATGF